MNPPSARRIAKTLLLAATLGIVAWSQPLHAALDPGEILVGEMGCISCHEAEPPVKARLTFRHAPVLGEKGWRLTPQWLRAYLLDPQAVKPGTVMPDLLATLPEGEKPGAAEALTQYLLSLQSPRELSASLDNKALAKGRTLYHSIGCVACHAPQDAPSGSANDPAAEADASNAIQGASSLARPEMKTGVAEMTAFLRDPLFLRPSGRMPSLNLSEEDANAVATYLLRAQKVGDSPQQIPGLTYEYYEETLTTLPKFERLRPKKTGIASVVNLDARRRDDNFALRFQGNLTAPEEGEYTFFVTSDDGSQLFIDDKLVVDNKDIHAAQERSGRLVLKRGDHAFTLLYFNNVGNRALSVGWQGPNLPKGEISPAAFSHTTIPMVPVGTSTFTPDLRKIEEGKHLFASLNCAACHAIGPDTPRPTASKPLASLNVDRVDSCIGKRAAGGLPQYHLSDTARQSIQTTLRSPSALTAPLSAVQQVERTMTALNCYACHQRDQHGGPENWSREYFTTAGEADLGDEGRLPPHLDGVGAKLRPEALAGILWQGAVARPYMATRMPQFGRPNVEGLPAAFAAADDPAPVPQSDLSETPGAVSAGRRLAGVGGLACIACHNFNKHPSLGIPAIDMTLMSSRLKPAWFSRYLLDPQSLRPGTRMPSFWPGGHAINTDILAGDTSKQIGALWQFLSKGKNADNPDGLIAAKMELLPGKDALIYRNFIQGGGARGIGVGYPEKANLVFDADEMRIDLIWQGAFIDASRHRTGRGAGFEPPLGVNVVNWTPGAPLAFLPTSQEPWPGKRGKEAGFQFKGYRLDNHQRPTFLYNFGNVRVEDYPTAIPGESDAGFHRELILRSGEPTAGLYFRAAVAAKIERKENSAFLVDGKVTVSLPGSAPVIRDTGKNVELLVPVTFVEGTARIEENLSW